jgi:hypothetical protein
VTIETTEPDPSTGSRLGRRCLGLLLSAAGVYLIASVCGIVPGLGSPDGSRAILASVGVLLAAAGIQVGQWVGTSGRLYDAVGAVIVTSMASMAGSVALFGDARGFRSSVGGGGVQFTSHGSVTAARIAFGVGAAFMGLIAIWAWTRVFRRRG